MPNWERLVNFCAMKPFYRDMEWSYNDYLQDSAPCKAGVTNQCAVRMSVALDRSGFSLAAFEPQRRVHNNRPACHLSVPHVLGANELARFLTRMWGEPEKFRGRATRTAGENLQGRTGVIYFNNCFRRRSTDETLRGDHIDLWNGSQYYNQIIHVGAGGDAGAGARLFRRADQVWFWPLN